MTETIDSSTIFKSAFLPMAYVPSIVCIVYVYTLYILFILYIILHILYVDNELDRDSSVAIYNEVVDPQSLIILGRRRSMKG